MTSVASSWEEDEEDDRLCCAFWWDRGELVLFALQVERSILGAGKQRCDGALNGPCTIHLHGATGTGAGTLLIVGGDDGLQILALPPLLASVTIGSIVGGSRDLLSFVDGGLFHVISIHGI